MYQNYPVRFQWASNPYYQSVTVLDGLLLSGYGSGILRQRHDLHDAKALAPGGCQILLLISIVDFKVSEIRTIEFDNDYINSLKLVARKPRSKGK